MPAHNRYLVVDGVIYNGELSDVEPQLTSFQIDGTERCQFCRCICVQKASIGVIANHHTKRYEASSNASDLRQYLVGGGGGLVHSY